MRLAEARVIVVRLGAVQGNVRFPMGFQFRAPAKLAFITMPLAGKLRQHRGHIARNQRMADDFQRRVIDDRNQRMAERAQPMLQAGKAFIAVGALHLPGDKGLLNLLEQQGYRIRRVY